MLDERWSEEEAAVADGLRGLLQKTCDAAVVRGAEAAADGRSPELETALREFGLWDLPNQAGVLTAAAWELGRALAPVPFVERVAVGAGTGLPREVWGERGWGPAHYAVVMRNGDGVLVRAQVGAPMRTAAGDFMAPVAASAAVVADADVGDRAQRLVRLLAAARAPGAAEGVLALGVSYAQRRQQFGAPIGAFQAVAHRLADAATAVDAAGLLVRKAAWTAAAQQGGDGAPDASFVAMARAMADDAAEQAAATTHQVMGGYGFTIEEDCQLFSRRIRSWRLRLESVGPELAALARRLLTEEGRAGQRWLWHHEQGLPLPRWAAEVDARA